MTGEPGGRPEALALERFGGRYSLLERRGLGSSSEVYRARDEETGGEVALKVLDPRLTWDPNSLERLRREVVVSRRVTHPGVVRVHDLVTAGDRAAIVQELVEGRPLAAIVAAEAPLPTGRALALARGVLEALAACHEKGIYHRDVKPSNVLVEAGDRPRLIDFGIARVTLLTTVTRTGAVLGTPGYQAPEILRGERPDLRCDLYGVGILLFEMLTGRPPFPTDGAELAVFRQLHDLPPALAEHRPDLPAGLDALVRSLLDPHAEMRPAGAIDVLAAIQDLESVPLPAAGRAECAGCGHLGRVASLPFCARCGRLRRIPIARGGHWVRLRGVDHANEYGEHLRERFGRDFRADVLGALALGRAPSAILARGVSAGTAAALAADARHFGAAAESGTGLGWLQLREGASARALGLGLGATFLVVAGLGQVLSSEGATEWLQPHVGALRVAIVLFMAGVLAWLIGGSTRAVLALGRSAAGDGRRVSRAAAALAGRVAALQGNPLASELARAIEAHWSAAAALRRLGETSAPAEALVAALQQILDRVLVLAERAGTLGRLLSGRGVEEAYREYERVQARRRAALGLEQELAQLEEALAREVLALEEAENVLSVAQSRLVLATGLFGRVARSLEDAARRQARETEIEQFLGRAQLDVEALEAVLAALRPEAGGAAAGVLTRAGTS